jgi:RNA 3'-terminal phosphate cyclase-like protein
MRLGSVIEINETGTVLKFRPGIIIGGLITHDCGTSRSIGWFIEGIIPLLLFAKEHSKIQFTGITNDSKDLSVDILKNVTFPLLASIGIPSLDLSKHFLLLLKLTCG